WSTSKTPSYTKSVSWQHHLYLVHILAASGTRIILSKIFHVESWLIHVLLGTFIGVTAPLIFYKLVVRYRLNFIFEYPSHKKITIV
ncbi:hypothetical protein ACSYGP_00005, partial [Klebsiella pneumoniae]